MKNLETAAGLRALMLSATLAACFSCAANPGRAVPPVAAAPAPSSPADSATEPPIVQIRQFPHSALVNVVAWLPGEAQYGLRASLRRDGELISDRHQLFVSTEYEDVSIFPYISAAYSRTAQRNFVETTAPAGRLLLSAGVSRDIDACYGWPKCSPLLYRAIHVPDELLRMNRDSLGVRFYGRGGAELIITIQHDLIDSYLRAVDSVSATLRKN